MKAQLNPVGLDEPVFDATVLAVSELVTNVIAHTDSVPVVTLQLDDDEILIELPDGSEGSAVVREPEVVPGYPDRILPKDATAAEVLEGKLPGGA